MNNIICIGLIINDREKKLVDKLIKVLHHNALQFNIANQLDVSHTTVIMTIFEVQRFFGISTIMSYKLLKLKSTINNNNITYHRKRHYNTASMGKLY